MNELKPCPYCNSTELEVIGTDQYFVVCMTKGCVEGPLRNTRQEAIDAWNQRTPSVSERTLVALKEIDTFNPLRDDRDMYLSLVADWGMGEIDEHPNAAEFGIVQEAT